MNILKINGQTLTGIYVDAAVSFNKPAKRVQTFEVPGRNGNLIIDEGTFDNVLISYPVYEKDTFPAEFDDLVNWLASLEGYQRIECSNDPGHYRLGRFVVPQTPTAKRLNRDGYYQLSFDCKPQRWLLSGEEETEIDNESIVKASDAEPYFFRTTGGAAGGSADIGDRETDKLVGGSIAWNQLNALNAFNTVTGGSIVKNADNSVTITYTRPEGDTAMKYFHLSEINVPYVASHVYLLYTGDYNNDGGLRFYLEASNNVITAGKNYRIFKNAGTDNTKTYVRSSVLNTVDSVNITAKVTCSDLTAMFGSTIADYIYSLEQANAGAGVAWFKKLFPKPYYAYNAGELIHVNASAHKMVGFNAYDPETGTAKVIGGQQYQITGAYTSISLDGTAITPDASGYFTPSANGTLAVTGGNSTDTCVHLVWDGERDGEYEPYEVHNYALDSDLVLRGIPKLDSANRLYYDGDTYESDGTVTRKYGIVDLGTLNWVYYTGATNPIFYADISNGKQYSGSMEAEIICQKYAKYPMSVGAPQFSTAGDKLIGVNPESAVYATRLLVRDTAYTDAATFKTAMSGVYLVYELATPTEEEADPYTNPQICSNWGTEEYVVTEQSGVAMPVGHDTDYFDHIGYAINNPTQFTSKPLIRVFGDGVFTVNDVTVTVSAHSQPYIDIDSDLQECYYEDTNMNQYVSFSGNEFPELIPGTNGIMPTPGIVKLEVIPRWWIL